MRTLVRLILFISWVALVLFWLISRDMFVTVPAALILIALILLVRC